MNSLVFFVETDPCLEKLFVRLHEMNKMSCIFASNLKDAIELFLHNEKSITHVVLNEDLGANTETGCPNIMVLAKIISSRTDFKGIVFVTSSVSAQYVILEEILGDKFAKNLKYNPSKLDTIQEIIKRILVKRQESERKLKKGSK